MTISAFSDELAQVRTKKKAFLDQIERIVPWKEWLAMIQPCYYKGERGNKPYPLEIMLRLYLLQNLYDLSDEATVAEAIDSRAFSEFCGVDSSNQVPDGDTLGRFRNLLIKNGLQEKLFAVMVAALCDVALNVLVKGAGLHIGIEIGSVVTPVVLLWYIITELGSIIENAGALGAPIPEWLKKSLKKYREQIDNERDPE